MDIQKLKDYRWALEFIKGRIDICQDEEIKEMYRNEIIYYKKLITGRYKVCGYNCGREA